MPLRPSSRPLRPIFGALVVLVACGAAPVSTSPPSPEPEPTANAHISLDADGSAHVTLAIPLAWFRADLPWVGLEFFADEFDDEYGYEHFVRLQNQPWPARFEQPGARLEVRYDVLPTHHQATVRYGLDEVSHPVEGGFFHVGRALLPRGVRIPDGRMLDIPIRIEWSLPAGARMATSVGEPAAGVSTLASFATATEAVYYVGDFHDEQIVVQDASVRLISSDFDEAELAPLRRLIRRTLELGYALLGPPAATEISVFIDQNLVEQDDGGVIGEAGVTVLFREPPDGRALGTGGGVVVHELGHLWNRADEMWLSEGYARYLEVLFRLRLDEADEDTALAEILSRHRMYFDAVGDETIRQAQGSLAYEGGAMWSFCVDGRLRAEDSSLMDVHRRTREATDQPQRIQAAALLAELRRTSSDIADYAEALLDHSGAIDVLPCLTVGGYQAELNSYRGLTPRALAIDVLRVGGYSVQAPVILHVRPDSVFMPGDVLLQLNGRSVHAVANVDRHLVGVTPGANVPVEVLRDGQRLSLTLVMPELEEDAWLEKTHVVATVAGSRSPLLH